MLNMVNSQVKKLYDELVWELEETGGTDWEYEEAWIEAAQKSEEEMNMLLKLYFSAGRDYYKLRLAGALAFLQRKEIIPDLKMYLSNPDRDLQFDMAWCLVMLGDEDGANRFLESALDPRNRGNVKWYTSELREEINTEYSHKLADYIDSVCRAEEKDANA